MIRNILLTLAMAASMVSCGASTTQNAESESTQSTETMTTTEDKYVEIKTSEGDIVVRLYGDTPKHQANFLKLVNEGYYDGVLFHRVINKFMIQTGDPDSKTAQPGQMLGSGGPGYQIDAEIIYPKHFHKRGALAAARSGDQVNPERRSSGSQFYIVTGDSVTDATLSMIAQQYAMRDKQEEFNRLASQHMDSIRAMQMRGDRNGLEALRQQLIQQVEAKFAGQPEPTLPQELADAYKANGGAPHLDGAYTVFGEVVSGMEVVSKIEKVQTNAQDRPNEDIKILSTKVISAPSK